MADPGAEEIPDAVLARLREGGTPNGTWLLEIELVRDSLRRADSMLRCMSDSIVSAAAREVSDV